ncbi:hypothetical protein [Pedobacter ginsengisoli]|uniref:hypothetical protein n=1 Tax=Pedobacter ginsengisoli TaxID=363852 RepID=UPI00254E944B|nr:hypothetical protein [Pedobacter ginsengisoli]
MKKINIKHVQNLHNEALRGLQFYKEEMNILQGRLEEITKDNTHIEVMKNVEHFQNQLIIQRNNMDELRHTINEHLRLITHQLEKTSYFVSENADEAQTKLYERYLSLEQSINELRHEFNRFAAKWM